MERDDPRSDRARRALLLHRIFELGVFAKAIDGAVELIGGLFLILLSPAAIRGIILFLVQGELKEDPTDLVANLLLHNTHNVIHNRHSASLFLILHGVVKLGLAAGLWAGRLWSYPAAISVFAGFAIYQAYQLAHQYSLFLAVVTVIDVLIIALVAAEYQHASTRHAAAREPKR